MRSASAKVARADRRDHELLDVDVAVGVGAAVEDVHHRHRQQVRGRAADVAEQRQAGRLGGGPGDGELTRRGSRWRRAGTCPACRRGRSAAGRSAAARWPRSRRARGRCRRGRRRRPWSRPCRRSGRRRRAARPPRTRRWRRRWARRPGRSSRRRGRPRPRRWGFRASRGSPARRRRRCWPRRQPSQPGGPRRDTAGGHGSLWTWARLGRWPAMTAPRRIVRRPRPAGTGGRSRQLLLGAHPVARGRAPSLLVAAGAPARRRAGAAAPPRPATRDRDRHAAASAAHRRRARARPSTVPRRRDGARCAPARSSCDAALDVPTGAQLAVPLSTHDRRHDVVAGAHRRRRRLGRPSSDVVFGLVVVLLVAAGRCGAHRRCGWPGGRGCGGARRLRLTGHARSSSGQGAAGAQLAGAGQLRGACAGCSVHWAPGAGHRWRPGDRMRGARPTRRATGCVLPVVEGARGLAVGPGARPRPPRGDLAARAAGSTAGRRHRRRAGPAGPRRRRAAVPRAGARRCSGPTSTAAGRSGFAASPPCCPAACCSGCRQLPGPTRGAARPRAVGRGRARRRPAASSSPA